MDTNNFHFCILFLLTLCIICGILLTAAVIYLFIKQKAAELSTHKLEYIPIDPNWASSDKEIEELNEQMQADLPDLDSDELMPEQARKRNLI